MPTVADLGAGEKEVLTLGLQLPGAVVILDAEDEGTPALVRQYVRDHGLAGVRFFGGRKPDGSMPWLNSPKALDT